MCDRPLCVNYGAPPQRKMSTKKRRENDFGYLFFCVLLSLLPLFFSSCCVCVYVCVSVVLFPRWWGVIFTLLSRLFGGTREGTCINTPQHSDTQSSPLFRLELSLGCCWLYLTGIDFSLNLPASQAAAAVVARDAPETQHCQRKFRRWSLWRRSRSVFIQKMCQSKLGRGTFRHIVNS